MKNQNEMQVIETTIDQVKEKIALGEALDVLHRSTAFKKLILNGYFKEKSIQLVKLTSLPSNEQQKELIKNSMVGISALQQYFHAVFQDASQAASDLEQYETALTEERSDV